MNSESPVYVVLGASGTLGSEVCRQLYNKGARIMMGARRVEKLDTLQEELSEALYFGFDANQMFEVERCIEQAMNMWSQVDGIVNCVSAHLMKPAHQTTEAEWKDIVSINLGASFAAVSAAGKMMMSNGGAVVLVASEVGQNSLPNFDAFSAASAGIMGLVRAASTTYAPFNIRINAVSPALVQNSSSESYQDKVPKSVPIHTAQDIAKVITWLLDAQNSLTGQILGVEEGLSKI